MFKTDAESLDKLSFTFDASDIARFKSLFEIMQKSNISIISDEELRRLNAGLDKIAELKLNGKIYAFHVNDSFTSRQLDDGVGEGVELYLRQGNRLGEFLVPNSRDWVYTPEGAIERLKKSKIKTVYTGHIPILGEFLGLPHNCDEDDPITRTMLRDYEIAEFNDAGIEVVSLDTLV